MRRDNLYLYFSYLRPCHSHLIYFCFSFSGASLFRMGTASRSSELRRMSEKAPPLAGPSRGSLVDLGASLVCVLVHADTGPCRLSILCELFQCVRVCLRAHGKEWLMCTDLTAVVADQVGLVIIYFWKWLTYGHWFIAVLSWLCALISWVFAVWLCTHACLHECSWITRFCNVCICSDFFYFYFFADVPIVAPQHHTVTIIPELDISTIITLFSKQFRISVLDNYY